MAADVDEQLGVLSPLHDVVEVQPDRGSATVAEESRRATGRQRPPHRFEAATVARMLERHPSPLRIHTMRAIDLLYEADVVAEPPQAAHPAHPHPGLSPVQRLVGDSAPDQDRRHRPTLLLEGVDEEALALAIVERRDPHLVAGGLLVFATYSPAEAGPVEQLLDEVE